MKKNMGSVDKTIRLILAVIFIALSLLGVVSGALEIVLLVLATIFALTSIIGSCPLYPPFGINTTPKVKK